MTENKDSARSAERVGKAARAVGAKNRQSLTVLVPPPRPLPQKSQSPIVFLPDTLSEPLREKSQTSDFFRKVHTSGLSTDTPPAGFMRFAGRLSAKDAAEMRTALDAADFSRVDERNWR